MKTLKLVGLSRYIAPFTKFTIIQKNDIIIVDDKLADHLLEGIEHSRDKGPMPHWEVCPDGTRATYDYSTEGGKVVVAEPAVPVEPSADEIEAAKRVAAAAAEAAAETEAARALMAAAVKTKEETEAAEQVAKLAAEADKTETPVAEKPVVAKVATPKVGQRVTRKPATK